MKLFLKLYLLMLLLSITSIGLAQSKQAVESYNQGEKAYFQRKYYSALDFYRQAIKINPYYKEADIGMGKAYFQLGNYIMAEKYFKMAEARFKNDESIKIWMAKVKIRTNRYASAESYLRKAIELQPKNKEIFIVYGDIQFKKINYRKAIKYYLQAVQIAPNNEMAYLKIGKSYLMLKKPTKALTYFEKAVQIDDKSPLTNYYLGEYYFHQKDYTMSEKHLKYALLTTPNHLPTMDMLYRVLILNDRWQEAKDLLEKLVVMNRYEKKYYYHLGLAYNKVGEPEKGIAILLDGLHLDHEDEALRFLAEQIYHQHFAFSRQKNNKRWHKLSKYWYERGINYLKQNLTQYALFSFKRGYKLNPTNWKMRYEIAKIYKAKGFTNLYYNELKVIHDDLDPTNQEISDEMRFAERIMTRFLSVKEGIKQYDEVPKTKPKLALLAFKKNNTLNQHYGIEILVRDVLRTALEMKYRLTVEQIDEQINFKTEEQIARDEEADFLIKGEVEEENGEVNIKLRIINVSDGEIYQTLRVFQRGTHRILSSIIHLSNNIEKLFPVFGQIIRKNYKEVIINVGKRHGYKVGNRFYVINSRKAFTSLLTNENLSKVLSHKHFLENFLLAFTRRKEFGLEEIEITQTDENISKGKVITSDFFDEVNINNYVINKSQ